MISLDTVDPNIGKLLGSPGQEIGFEHLGCKGDLLDDGKLGVPGLRGIDLLAVDDVADQEQVDVFDVVDLAHVVVPEVTGVLHDLFDTLDSNIDGKDNLIINFGELAYM